MLCWQVLLGHKIQLLGYSEEAEDSLARRVEYFGAVHAEEGTDFTVLVANGPCQKVCRSLLDSVQVSTS